LRPFDVIAMHPYGDGSARSDIDRSLQSVLATMRANRDQGKRIWVTELGWSTQGLGSVSEGAQAANMCQASDEFERFPEVERVYWYSLQDGTGSPLYPVQYFGLFHQDGSPKPAAAIFSAANKPR
jgi:hypothetical protein